MTLLGLCCLTVTWLCVGRPPRMRFGCSGLLWLLSRSGVERRCCLFCLSWRMFGAVVCLHSLCRWIIASIVTRHNNVNFINTTSKMLTQSFSLMSTLPQTRIRVILRKLRKFLNVFKYVVKMSFWSFLPLVFLVEASCYHSELKNKTKVFQAICSPYHTRLCVRERNVSSSDINVDDTFWCLHVYVYITILFIVHKSVLNLS